MAASSRPRLCSEVQKRTFLHEAAAAVRAARDAADRAAIGCHTVDVAKSVAAGYVQEELDLLSQCNAIAEYELEVRGGDDAPTPTPVLPAPSQRPVSTTTERIAELHTRAAAALELARSSSAAATAVVGVLVEPAVGLPGSSSAPATSSSDAESKRQRIGQ